jgi:hypothetical protein
MLEAGVMSDRWRILALKGGLALAFLLSLPFSYKLFLFSRTYPLAPVLGFRPPVPFPAEYGLLAVLTVLLGAVAVSLRPKPYLAALLLVLLFYGLSDQGRWYPSYYEYAGMFLVLGACFWQKNGAGAEAGALATLRFIVASVYFWSGAQKANPGFPDVFFGRFVSPITDSFPSPLGGIAYLAGYGAPVVEMAIGLGLLSTRGRTAALATALLMHAFIFFSIGPLRNNWNNAAWAWNVGSMLIVFLLFYRETNGDLMGTLRTRPAIHAPVLILFGLMPLWNFFGVWDSALSFNVYSGNTTSAVIYLDDAAAAKLPANLRPFVRQEENPFLGAQQNLNVLPVWRWSDHEFRAGPYPEVRVFRRILADVCRHVGGAGLAMEIRTKTDWLNPMPRTLHDDCQTAGN